MAAKKKTKREKAIAKERARAVRYRRKAELGSAAGGPPWMSKTDSQLSHIQAAANLSSTPRSGWRPYPDIKTPMEKRYAAERKNYGAYMTDQDQLTFLLNVREEKKKEKRKVKAKHKARVKKIRSAVTTGLKKAGVTRGSSSKVTWDGDN